MPKGVRYLGWAATLVAIVVYVLMFTVTLPHLASLAGGEPMFDMRPFGYDFGIAQEILQRLGSNGALYYETVEHRLDFAFPILLVLSLIFWLIAAARRWQGHGLPLSSVGLGVILLIAIIACAADLGENAAVSAMLAVGPDSLTPGMVNTASTFTMAKFFFSTVAYIELIILAAGPLAVGLVHKIRR
jgi:uncharacterized membrane protein YhaH (DUF805 family)